MPWRMAAHALHERPVERSHSVTCQPPVGGAADGAVDQHDADTGVDDFRAVDRQAGGDGAAEEWPTTTASSRSSASNTDAASSTRLWKPNPAGTGVERPTPLVNGDDPSASC